MGCDLCGSNSDLFSSIIENSLMNVCQRCLKFGKKVERNKNFNVNEVIKRKPKEETVILRDNYNLLIKENREKQKLTQDKLAEKLNEKVSLIQKVENKEIIPSDEFVKKLENFFHIKLFEKYKEDHEMKLNFQSGALTIGDLLRLKKRNQ